MSVPRVRKRKSRLGPFREDGSLNFQNRLCVPVDNELKKELLHESHNSVFTMHPRGNKMY